jgi:hypothetical protein
MSIPEHFQYKSNTDFSQPVIFQSGSTRVVQNGQHKYIPYTTGFVVEYRLHHTGSFEWLYGGFTAKGAFVGLQQMEEYDAVPAIYGNGSWYVSDIQYFM